MKVMLATLCLNEMEWLPRLFEQHKDWPGLIGWVFVESADRMYAEANPKMVTEEGLSVDGTSNYLTSIHNTNTAIYVPFGVSSHKDPAQGKCMARNVYLEAAEFLRPDIVVVLDADEFYGKTSQYLINDYCRKYASAHCRGYSFKQRHIWYPPSLQRLGNPLFQHEVIGAYWDIPHVRVWPWQSGMRYTDNHNTPSFPGPSKGLRRFDVMPDTPYCVHLGFASSLQSRASKHRYYVARGEGILDRRQMYVDCRAAFETWEPGRQLPHGAKIIPYTGNIPEVFQ